MKRRALHRGPVARGGRFVLALAGVLLAACASPPPLSMPAGVEYRPAPRTALATQRERGFLLARWLEGSRIVLALALRRDGTTPLPLARLALEGTAAAPQVSVRQLPLPWWAAERAELELATFEQLYALLLRQEPTALYTLQLGFAREAAPTSGLSHAQALKQVAALREQAAARAATSVPWRTVRMQPAPTGSPDADVVGVRALSGRGPLQGATVFFNRAPHAICQARTDAAGFASCRLVDPHGDEHLHDHAVAVVATFPGDLQPDRVLPPTTAVLPAAAPALPAFARPIPLPVPLPGALSGFSTVSPGVPPAATPAPSPTPSPVPAAAPATRP